MNKRQKKKIFVGPEADDLSAEIGSAPATARQTHKIVTMFEKDVPIEEAEGLNVEDEPEDDDTEPEEEESLDPIQQMLADLNVSEHSHSWTMIVERLPNYEKDGRYDVQAKRINCGTRPVSPDFVEDVRREFARPYKPNHFRITIKRDGKIFSHWPEVLSLEPPPYDEIAAFEARAVATAPPAITINNPGQPQSFKQMLDQFKQFAELRNVFFPELAHLAQQPTSASAQSQPLTTEAALLHLVSADQSLMEKAVSGLSRLFRKAEDGARDIGLMDIAFEAIKNNTLPQLVREFREMMREGAQLNGQPQTPAPALPQGSGPDHQGNQFRAGAETQAQPQSAPSDGQAPSDRVPADNNQSDAVPLHIQLLNFAVHSCANNAPIAATAQWIDSFEALNPGVAPYTEMFLAMTPSQALQWLAQAAPQTQPVTNAPHAQRWVAELQKALREEGGSDEPDGVAEGITGDR